MVKRKENTGLEKFVGTVTKVEKEESDYSSDTEKRFQYHIYIDPEDIEVEGATGLMHEWVPLSPKTSEEEVPQGSVMDRYLQQIELCIDEAKSKDTLKEVFALLEGKKFTFKRIELGRSFEGHPAKEYITPVQLA